MYFKRERSTATVIVLQIAQAILYFIAFALVLVAAGLFSRALTHINTNIIELERDVCILFITDSTSNPSPSICHSAIAIEALTGVGLMVLVIMSILKIALEMIKLVKEMRTYFSMLCDHLCISIRVVVISNCNCNDY